MRLFVIHTGYGWKKPDFEKRIAIMKNAVSADTEIVMECLEETDVWIDSQLDVALAAPEIVKKAMYAEKRGFDAVGIYCTSDPGLAACREALRIPVVGAGQAAFLTAMMLGGSCSFIATSASRISEKSEFARQCGMDCSRLASVRSIDFSTFKDGEDEAVLEEVLSDAVRRCRTEDHADVVILGCLSFAGMGVKLSQSSGIPVVDPAYVLASTMESLVRQKLSHSKQSYPDPPSRVRKWGRGLIYK